MPSSHDGICFWEAMYLYTIVHELVLSGDQQVIRIYEFFVVKIVHKRRRCPESFRLWPSLPQQSSQHNLKKNTYAYIALFILEKYYVEILIKVLIVLSYYWWAIASLQIYVQYFHFKSCNHYFHLNAISRVICHYKLC